MAIFIGINLLSYIPYLSIIPNYGFHLDVIKKQEMKLIIHTSIDMRERNEKINNKVIFFIK